MDNSSSLIMDWAISLADKREQFCRAMKPCPQCGTDQVQLVDWQDEAEWKCRHCHHKWTGV